MTHAPLASKQQEFARGLPAADRATLLVYNVVKLLIPMACLTHPTEWFIPPSRGPYLWLPLSCATMLAMQVMRILASQIDQEYLVGMRAMFNAMDTPGGPSRCVVWIEWQQWQQEGQQVQDGLAWLWVLIMCPVLFLLCFHACCLLELLAVRFFCCHYDR